MSRRDCDGKVLEDLFARSLLLWSATPLNSESLDCDDDLTI
jgi:hypothetical protein